MHCGTIMTSSCKTTCVSGLFVYLIYLFVCLFCAGQEMIRSPLITLLSRSLCRPCWLHTSQNNWAKTLHRRWVLDQPVSQSCAIFWRATRQSNLAYNRLAATKASRVWFSYSDHCTLANGAVFHSVHCSVARQNISLLVTAHCETGFLDPIWSTLS